MVGVDALDEWVGGLLLLADDDVPNNSCAEFAKTAGCVGG